MTTGKTLVYPEDCKYSESHEWLRLEGDLAVVGITDYAQDSLGDVVFVETPAVGTEFKKGDTFGVVESVKAASDLYLPASGKVQETNGKLADAPETINQDAFGAGWICKIRLTNPEELSSLMDAATYKSKIESGELH